MTDDGWLSRWKTADFLNLHPNLNARTRRLTAETRDLKTGTLVNLPSVIYSAIVSAAATLPSHFFFGLPATSDFFWWLDST
jgi:hypothetical protein